jgi:hypothetical protein
MTSLVIWAKRHILLAFFVLVYALSWMVEIPLALEAQGVIQVEIPFSLHYLAGQLLRLFAYTWVRVVCAFLFFKLLVSHALREELYRPLSEG